MTSFFGYDARNSLTRHQVQTSRQEIHRLNKSLEKLPELQSHLQSNKVQFQEMETELEEKKALGEKFYTKSSILEKNLETIAQELTATKNHKNHLRQTLITRDKKIEGLEKSLRELNLESTKGGLVLGNYEREVLQKELEIDKLKYALSRKTVEIASLKKNIEINNSELATLASIKNDLQEKTNQCNKKELEIETLQEQLVLRSEKWSEMNDRIVSLTNKIQNLETNNKIQWILSSFDQLRRLPPTLFRRK